MTYSQSALKTKSTEEYAGRSRKQAQVVRVKRMYDYTLLFLVIFMFAMGLLFIYSGSQYSAMIEYGDGSYYFKKQLIIGGVGLAGALVLSKIDYRIFKKKYMPVLVYIVTLLLLVLTMVMGFSSHGKTRWISIAGISFQPAEVAKIGMILFMAAILEKFRKEIRTLKGFIFAACLGCAPAFLILNQNISSAFIVAAISMTILFVAAGRYLLFGSLVAAMVTGVIAGKPIVRSYLINHNITTRPTKYWMRRIYGWALPEVFTTDAYQTQQGLYAIGSGGMTGRGFGESIQKFGKIPEVQNDMIFTVICEEFGFIGAAAMILLYIFILYRIVLIAKNARDRFGALICTGVMAHLGLQVILNIAVVTGVFPNTGVTLPFISYGGSAILFTMAEMGLVLSVSNSIKIRK